jgi:PEP-CTERM motif
MPRSRKLFFSLAALIIITAATTTTRADTITIVGAGSGQFSTATVVCEFNSQTNTFTFTITNTSAITQPGSTSTITGIGFDLPPTGNASASGLNGFTGMQAPSLSANFDFSDADLGNVPAGFNSVVLDFGFTTGPSGSFDGGSVNDGLLPGESASFTVTGAAFTGFTEEQICNAIFARFQNVPLEGRSGGSDVGTPGDPIPEPTTMLLLGTGLIGVAGAVRRKIKTRNC